MRRIICRATGALCAAVAVSVLTWNAAPALAVEAGSAAPALAPGLGDPGQLEAISFEQAPNFALHGPDARHQLLVAGKYATGQYRDFTRQVVYSTEPANVVRIDETGLVTPLADGKTVVTAKSAQGFQATCELTVVDFQAQTPINFANQITPIFTKLGCNGGGCHGKASGQNGFKLSLLGFEPGEDFEYLVKEGRGRRLFPAAPDQSLLLLKGINAVAHGGGKRLDKDSHEYRVLRRWISQGMPAGAPDAPKVAGIEVYPREKTMDRASDQQIGVIARYSDGSLEDVTRMTQFDPNDTEMAESSVGGLVHTLDLTGDVAIMARYQSNVDVFRASIPLGVAVDNLPPARNVIDETVFAKLKKLGVPPSPVCNDSTFIRRATLDIAGRLPTDQETEAFLVDTASDKRDRLVDRLLDSPDYADYFANKWNSVLRNKNRQATQTRGTYSFHAWIRDALMSNMPYDQFVRSIVAASGEVGQHPPVVWYREVATAEAEVEDVAQLFLGLRIQCARCHHHPFEKWSQDDYYGFTAFFSRVGRKQGRSGTTVADEPRIFHNRGVAESRNPKTGRSLKPTGLGAKPLELAPDVDPRGALVDWMAAPENPFFAPALVNRTWKHFFNRGIVDPEDDMRVTNPATNPELLKALSQHFIASKFDVKDLIRTICTSTVYQLSAEPNEYNLKDKQNYSRYYPKRLTAEVLFDAVHQVTNNVPNFNPVPVGVRAVQLPDNAVNSYFLTVFGRPAGDTACECERSSEANLAQSLHLLNSNEVQGKLSAGGGRAQLLAKDMRSDSEKVRELYRWAYSRDPDSSEMEITINYLAAKENKQQAYEDILWALINSKEFLFNH